MLTSKKDKLFTAIVENNIVAAEKLLKGRFLNNMSPNCRQKITPWIQSGQIKVGEQQHIWEVSDLSPLHLAVVLNQPEMVKKLLEYKADVNKQIFYVQITGANHVVSELLTPLFLSVYAIAEAANKEQQQKALEIYSVLRASQARLVGIDDPESHYFGTGMAQQHIDRHMELPEFKRACEFGEEHHRMVLQKAVFVEKLSQRAERKEVPHKFAENQQIKL